MKQKNRTTYFIESKTEQTCIRNTQKCEKYLKLYIRFETVHSLMIFFPVLFDKAQKASRAHSTTDLDLID